MARRVLSGIQPSGTPHLGNYLGALRNWVALQEKNVASNTAGPESTLFSIVDLHAITVNRPAEVLRRDVRGMAVALLACGVDPKRSSLFVQSQVPSHAELMWVLSTFTPLGSLYRMTQFKSKAAAHNENAGLLMYPVLMAADILLYKSTSVPVGHDQLQHLELARDVRLAFQRHTGSTVFPEPVPLMPAGAEKRVMSLSDPSKKMSKSVGGKRSLIYLNDTADDIRRKVRRAVTDSLGPFSLAGWENRPGLRNLANIYLSLSEGESGSGAGLDDWEGWDLSRCKDHVADAVIATIVPIGEEMARLERDREYIDSVLAEGRDVARGIAARTMSEVRGAVGLL